MIIFRSILLVLIIISTLEAQQAYWVFFEDGTLENLVKLTPKAHQRIQKRGAKIRSGNYSVAEARIDQLRTAGFKIRHASRFLNAVSLEVDNIQDLDLLNQFVFVRSIRPVAHAMDVTPAQTSQRALLFRSSGLSYGQSLFQNNLLQIPVIHGYGYDGTGVTIGVFDTGFLTEHPAFDQLDIAAQYDFVEGEPNPSGTGHEHGINVLSALGGYYPGELIGPAFGATYLLARTEDVNSESTAEEDNWVAALEWADSLGVDIISTSLNYRIFDNSADNYPISALDGETAIITRAANIAAERGILIVNSAANEGPSATSIWPPADSRHVLAVGAITEQGVMSSFSSRGPTYDGRIKPDVVALGTSVFMASGVSEFRLGNGTSFAAPLISGLAALLLQAQPGLAPDSIITLFHNNSSLSDRPDNDFGYGIPDLRQLFPNRLERETKNCLIFPNPSSTLIVKMLLQDPVANQVQQGSLLDIQGRLISPLTVKKLCETTVEVTLPAHQILADQLFIVAIETNHQLYTGKLVYIK